MPSGWSEIVLNLSEIFHQFLDSHDVTVTAPRNFNLF